MPSLPARVSSELGWTAVYVGLVVAAASLVFAEGVPVQGCYPGCVGAVDATLALAGVAALVVGGILAAVGSRLAHRE